MLLDSVFPHPSHKSMAGEGSAPSKHHMLIIAGTNTSQPLASVCRHPLLQQRGCCMSAVSEAALPSNSHCKVLKKKSFPKRGLGRKLLDVTAEGAVRAETIQRYQKVKNAKSWQTWPEPSHEATAKYHADSAPWFA